ncbi:mandelate racemase/muconate lactonizing enzyme family protein [Ramlibacter sp. G-1-2-2]|uniref:Mandelate racemase/muconate lactonizing enzyme family protein n=1 Tax=Ramlibacter agri TaxID=2728837 RepID=A0A848HCW1_9BURK|nr:mandelate racemase/muconate lactonizing enzyme family protein [Ramlibacter agri]NML48304.1 mandelate racemase/muconate lactonizing enzyme family protein [Ramlibacter agri]
MDPIQTVEVALYQVPLKKAVSDAKVLTGRQRPLAHVDLLTATIETVNGARGFGFSYSLRAGGSALLAHAKDLAGALVGEDPNDIGRLWEKLAWLGASVSRTGVSVQSIAAFDVALWDLKAKSADVSIGKLLGAYRESVPCYNTSGGYLNASTSEVLANVDRSLELGLGGIKLKVGQPELKKDIERVAAVRKHVGDDVPMMVDANQQWDVTTALRAGRMLDPFNLVWLEEPTNAYDYRGHAQLKAKLDTPIATGEMLSSVAECGELIRHDSVTFLQPDVPRVGGITPFLKIANSADLNRLKLAPHFVMEIHIHLGCAYPHEAWVEHIEWLEPAFNERLEIKGGQMFLPQRPGLGFSLSEEAARWRVA